MRTFTRISIFLLSLFITTVSWSQVVYVNGAVTSSGTGGSWSSPVKTIEEALMLANSGDEIWIAKGEYNPVNENYTHALTKSLSFYGGFNGDELDRDSRDIVSNKTTFTNIFGDKVNTLFEVKAENLTLTFDGFSVTKLDIFLLANNVSLKTNLTIKNCEFFELISENNFIVYAISSNGILVVDNCNFYNDGGSLFGEYDKVEVVKTSYIKNGQSFFIGSCKEDFSIANSVFKENSVMLLSLYNSQANFIMQDCKVEKNINGSFNLSNFGTTTIKNSLFFGNNNCDLNFYAQKLIIDNCHFESDTASNRIYYSNSGSNDTKEFYFINSSIKNCSISYGLNCPGGGKQKMIKNSLFENINYNSVLIYCGGGTNVLDQLTFNKCNGNTLILNSDNNSRNDFSNIEIKDCQTSSVFVLRNEINFNNIFIDNCKSSDGIQFDASYLRANNLNISNCLFSRSITFYQSYVGNNNGRSEFINCRFNNIQAQEKFLYFYGSAEIIKFNNCQFESIKSVQDGGAVHASAVDLEFNNCKFINNSSNGNGGAVSLSSPGGNKIKVNKSKFQGNKGQIGGAIYLLGTLEMVNSDIIENFANQNGGGVFTTGSFSILNSNFLKNKTIESGSAIYASYGGTFINCIFRENDANIATIFRPATNSKVSLYNCIINKNIAQNSPIINLGSYAGDQYATIFNSVIYGNKQTDTDSIFIANYVYNSIIFNNAFKLKEATWVRSGQFIPSTPNNFIHYSNVEGGFNGTGNLDLPPKFADPENGDFRLTCESPMINKGSNTYAQDINDPDGRPRIVAGIVDMGAYEFPGDPDVATATPEPDFNFSNGNPCIKESIGFINVTDNKDYFTYKWNFGDASSLVTGSDTTHAYSKSGKYFVELIATNACGRSVSKIKEINIKPSFIPSILYPTTVKHGDTISFRTNAVCQNLSWSVNGGTIESGNGTNKILVRWGDGISGNGQVKLMASDCGDDKMCEFPVEVEIPIMPKFNSIIGDTLACYSSVKKYTITNRAYIPGSIYKWSVKNGTISGVNSGYGLDSIFVTWSSWQTNGVVYLTITNELLKESITDSLQINIRPSFVINDNIRKFCSDAEYTFSTNPAGTLVWKISGNENQIETSTGKSLFGAEQGSYVVSAMPLDSMAFCTWLDTLNINVYNNPVLDSISGEKEVLTSETYEYKGYYKGDLSDIKWLPFNNQYSITGNPVSVRWNKGEPFGFIAYAESSISGCRSNQIEYTVKPDYTYEISGPDQICISSSGEFQINEDPSSVESFTWKLNGRILNETSSHLSVEFIQPGNNIISATVLRNGKTYTISKRIVVNYIASNISVSGPRTISPQGGGTYEYRINNPSKLDLQINVAGDVSHSVVDTVITITWNSDGPYEIVVTGSKTEMECTTIPFKLQVNKARILSKELTLTSGSLCPNTTCTYSIQTDESTENVRWSLDGGGTITRSDKNFATVQWGEAPGTYKLTVTYDRFGTQTLVGDNVINAAPEPQIGDNVICGDKPVTLNTLTSYVSYNWTEEPSGQVISTQSQIKVSKGGIYSVKVVDQNGCWGQTSRNILAVPDPLAKISTSAGEICTQAGSRDVSLSTIEGGDYIYDWYVDGVKVGGSSSIYNFTQNLSAPGTHIYKVKATSAGVCTAEHSIPLRILTSAECPSGGYPCTESVSFTVSGYQPFNFNNTSSQSKGFNWNFGDGTSSQVATNINHTFADIGIYNVTLQNGCAISRTTIKVPVLARFAAHEITCQFAETEFKDFSVNLPGYPITSWQWNFGDGTSSAMSSPKHVFSTPGVYNVSLTVSVQGDQGPISHTFTKEITVSNKPSVAFTIAPPECNSNLYNFIDNSSYITSYAIYNWDLGDGLNFGITDPSARYTPGSKKVSLKVTDLVGCSDSLTKSFDVLPVVARKQISAEGNLKICYGDSVLLSAPIGTANFTWKRGATVLPDKTSQIFAKENGLYTVDYLDNGCQVTSIPLEVKVFELSNSAITFNGPTCQGNALNITIPGVNSDNHSIIWSLNNQTLPVSSVEYFIGALTSNNAGIYSAIITEKISGCEFTMPSKELTVHANPLKPILDSPKANACFNDTVTVIYSNPISNPYKVVWTLNKEVLTDEQSTFIKISPDHFNSTVSIKITEIETGCVNSSADFNVSFGREVHPKLSGNIEACERSTVSLGTTFKSEEYDFKWFKNGLELPNSFSRIDFASLDINDAGSYHAVLISKAVNNNVANCEFTTDTVIVNVKSSPPKPEISGESEFCQGTSLILESSVNNNIVWNTGETSSSITVFEKGVYNVTATDPSTGCQAKNSFTVVENPAPDFRFIGTGVYEFCGSEPLILNGLVAYHSFQWKLNGVDYGKPNKDLYPRKSGSYTVFATTDKGCVGESDTLRVKSLPCACTVVTTEDGLNIGSLRDAINCANTKEGPDNITFEIEGIGPHAILLDSILPVITESVVIDGFSQSGDNVYDIIIKGGLYQTNGLIQASGVTESEFRGLQFEGLENAISLDFGDDDNTIERNRFIGITNQAVKFSGFIKNAIVKDNYFEGTGRGEALSLSYVAQSAFSNNTIKNVGSAISLVKSNKNTIKDNAISLIKQHGISLISSSTGNTLSGNTILDIDSSAVLISASDDNTLKGNYIGITKQGQSGLVKLNGIKTVASANTVITTNVIAGAGKNGVYADSKSIITDNTIQNAGEYGIYAIDSLLIKKNNLTNSTKGGIFVLNDQVRISQNKIIGSTDPKAIELDGKGNTNKLPAEFEKYEFINDKLVISGRSVAGDTVEVFLSNQKPQQAIQYIDHAIAGTDGKWSLTIAKGVNFNPNSKNYYVNTASAGNNTSELSVPFTAGCLSCICRVANADDAGLGSLRAAVDSAHAGSCLNIEFEIAPTTIQLQAPLRDINVQLNITGKPGMIIDGPATGSAFTVAANHFNIKDLSFIQWDKAFDLKGNNANLDNIQINETTLPVSISGNNNKIGGSCINCNSRETRYPVVTGIEVKGNNNLIGYSGNPNTIVDAESGVLVNTGKQNTITYNIITGSKKGIAHLNTGNSNYPAPVDLEGTLDTNKRGIITGKAKSGDKIQVFLSDFSGRPASDFVIEATAINGAFSIKIPSQYTPVGENSFFILTATGTDGNTSEFSKVVKIGDNTVYCVVRNTDDSGEGSLRAAVGCVNDAGIQKNNAVIVFDLPLQTENIIEVKNNGFVITNNEGVVIDPQKIKVKVKSEVVKLPYAFHWEVNRIEMKGLAFEGFDHAIEITRGSSNRIVGNTFTLNDTAVYISKAGLNTVSDNIFKSGNLGVYGNETILELTSNTFGGTGNALVSGAHLKNADYSVITWNQFTDIAGDNAGLAKGLIAEKSSKLAIKNNNTHFTDKINSGFIIIEVDSSIVSDNILTGGGKSMDIINSLRIRVYENKFADPSIAGIHLDKSEFIDISKNTATSLTGNAKPIHLNYKLPNESNEGYSIPEFTNVTYAHGKVVYKGKAYPESTIEIFDATLDKRDMLAFRGTAETDRFGNFEYSIAVSPEEINKYTLIATATYNRYAFEDGISYTSEASEAFNPNLKYCYVTKESDEDQEGTLRYNIKLANKNECNLMLFDVNVSGQVNITPDVELPVITASRLIIDATSQPGYSGAPVVNILENKDFSEAFKINSEGNIFIHGVRVKGYVAPVVVEKVNYFENSYSAFEGFTNEGISILSSDHKNIRLEENFYKSETADYIWNFNKSNIFTSRDSLVGGKSAVVNITGDSIVLLENALYGLSGNGYAILASQSDSLYAFGNKFGGTTSGAKLDLVSNLVFMVNDFDVLRGSENLKYGIHATDCKEGDLLMNTISNADTAIVIYSSEGIHCDGNVIDACASIGVVLSGSDKASVSNNTITNTPIGIKITASTLDSLIANTILGQDSTGILVDSLSDQQVIVSNSIGAESFTSEKTSNGSGMMIYSSGNLIGGADSLGNKIIGNESGGVLVIKGTSNKITYNVFLNNDYVNTAPEHFAIWHQNNGNELKAKPVIKGVKEVKRNALYVVSGEAEPNDSIHLYRSDGHYQNARFFAGHGIADASGKWSVTVDTSVFEKQLIFSTLTIVATATDDNNNTSQFSDIAYLGPCYVTSPEDNTDNAYPVPNSFRQAVVCANMQDGKAEIKFFLDNSSGFEIGLQREMIPMDNPFGVSFDGLNLKMEQYTAMKKGLEDVSQFAGNDTIAIFPEHSKEVSDTTVFWRIASSNGRSEFKNMEVYSFDTAFVLKAPDSINISHMKFVQIPEYAIVLEEGSKDIYMNYLKLLGFGKKVDSLNRITTFNEGLLYIDKNATDITLTNSTIQFAKTGVVINEATNINISDNSFDKLALSVISDKTDTLNISNNTFNRGNGFASAIIADATSANISGNEISNYKYGIPVVVSNSSDVNFSSNNFKVTTDTVDTAVWFNKCDNSRLSGNNFDIVKISAILIESCDSVLVQENSVQKTKGIGYDIVNSEKTTLSRNLVISKTDSTGLLINIYKNVSGKLSNKSKEEPVIEGYLVQRLKDCKEEKLGIYLYGKSEPKDSIEVFSSDTLITVFKEYITGGRADEAGKWMIRIPEKYYNRKPNYKFSFAATAMGKEENNTSQESNTFTFGNVVNELVVKNTKDSGPGSLRQAIEDINCSDIYSVVYFNIDGDAPYKILLKDSLPAIVATNGFKMDGKTQADYHQLEGIDAEATIYVDASALPDSIPLFVLAAECDSSSISRMTLLNAAQSIVLNNIGNKLDSLTIRSSLQRRDKAVLLPGGANELSNSVISGYERGVYITGKGNVVRNSVLKDNTISVEVKGEGSNNLVADNNIVSDSISISIRGTQEANFISRNHIGSWDHPLKYPAIKLENASHQYITGSLIPYAEVDQENYETSAFIYIGDSSNYNTLSKNRIGMEKDAKVVMKGNIPGIKVSTELPGQKLLGNSLNRNEIAGLTVPALIMNHVESGIVADNFFGVDSGYVQMNLKSHYKDVSGIDTTSVLVMNSAYVTFIGNEMVNFRDYGIDVRNSESISINQNKVFSEYSNQKGIQLNLGTAMESNEGVKAPVIDTNKVISKDRIQISGTTIYPQAEVQIFSGFTPESQDTVLHALRYITSVVSDNDGNWVAELPSNDFGFNKFNKYIAQVNKGLNSSEFSNIYTVKSLLCMLMDVGVDLIGDLYEPCPQSQFKLDAQLEGLHYSWSAPEFDSTLTTRIAQIDKSAHVTLTLKDDFGCELKETFEVRYKEKPEDPIFIVSTNTFVSDTIVLVDVSTTRLDQYDWSSSDGLSIVSAGELATFKGPDGKDYPVGREVRFIAPDTGTYVMTQRSIRDGCFVKLDKEIHVTNKIPGQGNPNVLDPGENNLYVHPSPFLSSEGANIFIETAGEGETEVLILDGLGRILLTWNVSGKKSYNIPIPKGKLNQGFYIVKVGTVSSSMTFKFEVK